MSASEFFSFVRSCSSRIFKEHGDALAFCSALATNKPAYETAILGHALLPERRDERDYAVSTAYALLIGTERRKHLSAYFTPPA